MNVSTSSTGKPPASFGIKNPFIPNGPGSSPANRPAPRLGTSHELAIKLLKLLRGQFALGGAAVAAFDTELQFVGTF